MRARRNRLLFSFGFVIATSAAWPCAASAGAAPPAVDRLTAECVAGKTLSVGGGRIAVDYDAAAYALGAAPICRWIALASIAVDAYFGRYPVQRVQLSLKAADGDGVRGGTTYGDAGGDSLIVIPLGRKATQAQLDADWVMTHEMVHLAVPSVPRPSHWLEEGIATYVEPIARAQLGQLDEKSVWADMLEGMPKGLPRSGDRGLDRTPTWGRTYWGGGLYCLLADVAIRERTRNRKSLRDALRGVIDAGGSIEKDWTLEQVLTTADKATGTTVLSELHQHMGEVPGPDELDSLWKKLGVSSVGDEVRFDSTAPRAAVRAGITTP